MQIICSISYKQNERIKKPSTDTHDTPHHFPQIVFTFCYFQQKKKKTTKQKLIKRKETENKTQLRKEPLYPNDLYIKKKIIEITTEHF